MTCRTGGGAEGGSLVLGVMGQEAGKSAWPKPAGGYQTITGRRYGRRHAYVSFRPTTSNQDRIPISQQDSGVLFHNICPALNDNPSLENAKSEAPLCMSAMREREKDTPPFSMVQKNVKGQQASRMNCIPDNITEDYSERAVSKECIELHNQNGIAYVNIDSYEPDSSEREDSSSPDLLSIAEEADKLQKTLDNMLLKLEKEVISLNGLQSHLSMLSHDEPRSGAEENMPVPLTVSSNLGMDSVQQNNKRLVPKRISGAGGEKLLEINANNSNCEMQPTYNKADVAVWTPVELPNELNTTDCRVEQGNELVVRPKVKKQMSQSHLDKKKPHTGEEAGKGSTISWAENTEMQWGSPECIRQHNKEKMHSNLSFESKDYDGAQKKTKNKAKHLSLQEEKSFVDDCTFWEDFEDYNKNLFDSKKDEDSSDHSDGEWSASLPLYTGAEKDHSSSDESWETLPGKEEQEPDLQSNSSSLEEENSDFSFQAEEQTSLEEGEIPWLQYHEEIENSSDEENDAVSHFVHPGFFMLDGNNNLEDDSSMSEDLDVEWRLLDEFGDGLGVAQAISYVDPLTYMALEERLTQAMETALAHLESLAVDVEQAHPPASKESIDSLPQIIVADDHNGQEQCCAICCSEYMKDEIITELPCRHLFHKPCVTLWLQKSGTCPVCRHVFAPVPPEAAAAATATSFLSDHDIPPSVRGDAGTR